MYVHLANTNDPSFNTCSQEGTHMHATQMTRDCPINRTCRLIAHSTSDFDDRLQFYKIDYFDYFEKINCI